MTDEPTQPVQPTRPTESTRSDPNAQLTAIRAETDPAVQAELVNAFLTRMEPVSRQIAYRLCQKFALHTDTWLPDISQCVRLVAHGIITEYAEGKLASIETWRGLLALRAQNAVVKFLDSTQGMSQLSGLTSTKRKLRKLERVRSDMRAQLGGEPTDQEVVEETNRQLKASRTDPSKIGTVRIEDLAADRPAESLGEQHDRSSPVAVETDADLHPVERRQLITMAIERCDRQGEILGKVARAWLGVAYYDHYDQHPTAAAVARQVGIAPVTARHRIAEVKAVVQELLADHYGIARDEQ